MRNQSLINKINEAQILHTYLNHENIDQWSALVDEIRAELVKISTGKVRYIEANIYSGNGSVRISELGDASVDVVSFHKESCENDYEQGQLVEFDGLDLETHRNGLKIVAMGLRGPVLFQREYKAVIKAPEHREYVFATENEATLVGYDQVIQLLSAPALTTMLNRMKNNSRYVDVSEFNLEFNGEKLIEVQWGA